MKKSFSNLLAPLLAILITFLFFLPNLLLGKIPFPSDIQTGLYHPFRDAPLDGYKPETFPVKNPLISDPILQTYPWRHQVIANLKDGQWPLWNPYSFSGQPLLANIQSSTFQLTNLLFVIFPFNIAWAMSIILPSIVTALFMYLLLRDLGLSKTSSVFGAVAVPFSGFYISWLSWGSIAATVMWLPLILLSTNKLVKKISPWWFLLFTFAISQIIFSGHWQAAMYVAGAAFIFLVLKLKESKKPANVAVIILALFLGLLTAAVQILPAAEFLDLSSREVDQKYFPLRQDWFIPYQHLIQLIVPDFFGNPATYNYWGVFNYGEFVSFIGIIPLSLCLLAIIKRVPNTKFFIILAAVALVLGLENPISKIPYVANLPFISSAQPSRVIFLLNFALVALAAFGLETFTKDKSRFKNFVPLIIISSILLILLAATFSFTIFPQDPSINTQLVARRNLAVPIATIFGLAIIFILKVFNVSGKLIVGLIFLLTTLELFRFGLKFISFSKISWIFPKNQTTEFLSTRQKPFRILTTDRRIMHPNLSSVYKIESVDGYDPLYLLVYNQLVSSWQSNSQDAKPSAYNRIVTPQRYDSPITNILNVKYILTFDQLQNPNFVKVFEEGQTKVYENLKALPRAYFVQEVIKVDTKSDELKYLLDPNFDSASTAVSQDLSFKRQEASASAIIADYKDQQIKIATYSDREMPLVVGNVYYPGWQAYIDGQKTQVHKVNYLHQSVIIPQGNHMVEFKFQPKSFYNGAYLSAAGLLASIAFAGFIWKRKSL